MSEAIEITSFRLARGTCAEFITANADVDAWLRRQPGFHSRRICERSDGLIVDMLIWASVADGEAAAGGVMTELADLPIHALIDQATVSWSVSPVRHTVA